MTFSGEGRVRTSLLGLTGHQLVGAAYSNKQFKSIDQCLDFIFQNHRLATTDGSWAVYYNFDQLLYETDKHSGRGVVCSVDLARLTATRISCTTSSARVSAGRVSFPIARTTSSGWATTISTSQTRRFKVPQSRSVPTGRVGFEASYDLAVTAIFTPDIQVIGPAQKRQLVHGGIVERIGSATVLGVRLRIAF